MDKKTLITSGLILITIQMAVGLGVFVTYPQMASYAVSKDTMSVIIIKLDKIDTKIDNILMKGK